VGAPTGSLAGENGRKFYSDDPLWREPTPRAVREVAIRKVDDAYDFLANSYFTPARRARPQSARRVRRPTSIRWAKFPNSAWYTNRHAIRRMSIAELQRGSGQHHAPNRSGGWTIVGREERRCNAGFVIEDENKHRYLLKLDPPDFPELCSAADVIGSKFFHALGYFTPENYIVHFHREDLAIRPAQRGAIRAGVNTRLPGRR